jgi:cyclomaltodextrinase / maltogenic alpha-amylase / neopullulanase
MKFMTRIGFWALAALLMVSCNSTNTQKDEVTYVTHLPKLATPIHLSLGESRVLLTDYFPDPSGIEKAELNGKALAVDSLGVLTVNTSPSSPVNNLRVLYKSVAHDIPVFASEKTQYTFTYKASSDKVKSVGIAGSMNGWNYKSSLLVFENGLWTTSFELNPGIYSYRIWEDGSERMDGNNPQTMDNGMGGLNNIFVVGNPKAIAPQLTTFDTNEKSITAKAELYSSICG